MSEFTKDSSAVSCSNCGSPMSLNDFVCKNCWTDVNGNKVDKSLYKDKPEKSSASLEDLIHDTYIEYSCSNCGAELKEEDKICSNCGADVSEVEEEFKEDDSAVVYHCGNCDSILKADDSVCPKCGAEIMDEETEEAVYNCPDCGEVVNEDDNVCAKCGAELFKEIPDDFSKTIVLRTFNNVFEAGIIKELLSAHGIESYISTDDEGGMAPFLTQQRGARLLVMEEDFKNAFEIINAPGENIELADGEVAEKEKE